MPYIVLILGIIIAVIASLKFFASAKPDQVKSFLSLIVALLYTLVLLYFAFSGRIIIALIGFLIAIPFIIAHFKKKLKNSDLSDDNDIDEE